MKYAFYQNQETRIKRQETRIKDKSCIRLPALNTDGSLPSKPAGYVFLLIPDFLISGSFLFIYI